MPLKIPLKTLAPLGTKGGILITNQELMHLARRGVLLRTLGNMTPHHLPSPGLFLREYVAVQFTRDFTTPVLAS